MKRYDHYESADGGCKYGDMICTACSKEITSGDFRVRLSEKHDAYQPQHRACSEQDAQWAILDAKRKKASAKEAAYKSACEKFARRWGVPKEEDFIFEDQPHGH